MFEKSSKKYKKAAIQLSMSFLVMLIIAIVIFVLSLVFLGDFFDQSVKLKTSLDQQTRAQIESMLKGNERVAIPLDTKKIKRGDSTNYGVGIRNTLSKEYFTVILKGGVFIPIESPEDSKDLSCSFDGEYNVCNIGSGYSNQNYDNSDIRNNIQYLIGRNGKIQVPMNNEEIVTIALQSGSKAPRGHYIFNVQVCSDITNSPNVCNSENGYGNGVYKIHLIIS
jgi:hypothetical protein